MQRGFSGVLLLFVVLLLAAGGFGGYYLLNLQKLNSINSFEECAKHFSVMESYPEQCNTSDGKHFVRELGKDEMKKLMPPVDTSSWNFYQNTRVGFELKYPKGYSIGIFISPNSTLKVTGNEDNATLLISPTGLRLHSDPSPDYYLSFFPFEGSLDNLIKGIGRPANLNYNSCLPKIKGKDLQFNGINAVWFQGNNDKAPVCRDGVYFISKKHGFLLSTNRLLTLEEEQEYIEPMLSTFKFVDDETANWKTYKNNTYKYSYKYPSDWELTKEEELNDEHSIQIRQIFKTTGDIKSFSVDVAEDSLMNSVDLHPDVTMIQEQVIIKDLKGRIFQSTFKNKPGVSFRLELESNGLYYDFDLSGNDQISSKKLFNAIIQSLEFLH